MELNSLIFVFAALLIAGIFLNKVSARYGIPALLLFLGLGLIVGWKYDNFATENDKLINAITTVALAFIIFYGGFGTRWKTAKSTVIESGILATLGVVATAAVTGLFCHFVLKWNWCESLLMGSVISSTDAASVFYILRTKKLGLRNNTAPILEMESGSNDPMSYMLTFVMITIISKGSMGVGAASWMIFKQLVFGAGGGVLIAFAGIWLMNKIKFHDNGFDIFVFISITLISYALPSLIDGNGYLSAYIVGIIMGNSEFPGKKDLVTFFNTLTNFAQLLIFYYLGAMALPSHLLSTSVIVPAILIFVFLTLVARPVAIFGLMAPFKKYPVNQLSLISFAGLRGAASIVFAILISANELVLDNDIFSIVFVIVILSIALQGSLLPTVAKLTNMTDEENDVMTTFNDFEASNDISFTKITVEATSLWKDNMIKDLHFPKGILVVLIIRDGARLIPRGDTIILEGDQVIVCGNEYQDAHEDISQQTVNSLSDYAGRDVREIDFEGQLLVLIQRGDKTIIPNGDTTINVEDKLYIMKLEKEEDKA